ncbi:MAG: DNA replication/repair protein RecF [Candidatus Dormibacteria bacterium]
MYISQLRLLNFRIYQQASVDLLPGVNLVLGANGGGKTSLLEAIATLALTRSPRSGAIADFAAWEKDDMGVSATLCDDSGRVSLEFRATRQADGRRWVRTLRKDGQPAAARQVLGKLGVVLFWPEDLLLIKGGPEPRRRMMDVVLSQLSPQYAETAVRYRRGIEHRNAVLRGIREGSFGRGDLAPWNEALASHGAELMEARSSYLEQAGPVAAEAAAGMGEPGEVGLIYRPGLGGLSPGPKGEFAQLLRGAMAEKELEEIARAQSVVGPHRDDFDVTLGGRPARQFASQGQQRSLVLALKVAEVRRHMGGRGAAPVLLLDDVLSELDLGHRTGLIGLLGSGLHVEQTLITATEEQGITAAVPVAQVLDVTNGRTLVRR